jgi:dTDP-4-amino-4,6-dideoxy-D-glucose transaminase
LLQLTHIDHALQMRKGVDSRYREALSDVAGITVPQPPADTDHNCGYFPILVEADYRMTRDALYQRLREAQVLGRRYFYPLVSNMPMYRGLASAAAANLPVANRIANQVLCLPIYPDLNLEDQARVIRIIRG